LRDANFRRALDKFFSSNEDRRFRTTINRLLTKSQINEMESMVMAFINAIVDLPDNLSPTEAESYTVGVFAFPRNFGNG